MTVSGLDNRIMCPGSHLSCEYHHIPQFVLRVWLSPLKPASCTRICSLSLMNICPSHSPAGFHPCSLLGIWRCSEGKSGHVKARRPCWGVSGTTRALRFLPVCKLTHALATVHGCGQETWDSWVRVGGRFYHSTAAAAVRESARLCQFPEPSSPRVMWREPDDTHTHSRLHYRRGTWAQGSWIFCKMQ